MEKYGFVYIWYDRKHKRYYIGCRWGNENDRYICSSVWMRNAYVKRPDDFKRRILSRVFTNRKELLEVEYHWLSKIKKEELGNRYYNLNKHHFGHWSTDEETTLVVKEKNKKYWTKENREKAAEKKRGSLNPMKRPDVVEKRLETYKKGNHSSWNKGIKTGPNPEHSERMKGRAPPNKGIPLSKERKQKISEDNKNRKWCYCIETKKCKRILKTEPIPEGFLPGRPHAFPKKTIEIQINNITYKSYSEASKMLNMSPSTVRNRCVSDKEKFSKYIIINAL